MSIQEPRTRIQRKNHQAILEAALEVFARSGFAAATLDQIASEAGMSKPNLLYYFPSKEAIHLTLLSQLMDTWLDPMRDIDPDGEPVEELLAYVRRKLQMSREMPRESRLFAHEIIQGAPHMGPELETVLRPLVMEKAAIVADWSAAGRIATVDPVHLIFSIWSLTQHYADFDVQVRKVLGPGRDPWDEAAAHLETLFGRMLAP
ncbi:TetR family transcriptional regulator [Rhodobacterales bacterium HKCCE2091]|nr:TetR family transcriptional regulator [Rhodobacterales bacterium HKCCE2091]